MKSQTDYQLSGADAAVAGSGRTSIEALVLTGLMTALVFAATSFFKIPVVATNGYIHLGDAMIFMSVLILGRKNGTVAAASGSALADLIGGYMHWVPWTFVIKGLMAFVFGTVILTGSDEKASKYRKAAAYLLGSIVMISGYFIAQRIIYGTFAAPLAALPGNIAQAAAGIAISEIAYAALGKTAPQLLNRR